MDFPEDPADSWNAVGAVFGSWRTTGRSFTAACTASPRSGGRPQHHGDGVRQPGRRLRHRRRLDPRRPPAPGMYGDFLVNAQGEDVVNGSQPQAIEEPRQGDAPGLKELLASARSSRSTTGHAGHRVHHPANKLYMLQWRNGKRTGFAAVRVPRTWSREVDHAGHGHLVEVHPGRRPEPAAAAALPRGGQEGGEQGGHADQGHPGRPRRRHRQDRVLRRRGRGAEAGQSEGGADPVRKRDDAGGHPRDEGGAGHPDGVGRRASARGPGEPPDGQGLHRRLPASWTSTRRPDDDRQGRDPQGGRRISIDGFTGEVFGAPSTRSRARSCRSSSRRN